MNFVQGKRLLAAAVSGVLAFGALANPTSWKISTENLSDPSLL